MPSPNLITADNPPFRPITLKPIISFSTRDVQGPSDVYITVDDVIHLEVWNSAPGVTLQVNFRVLRADGQITRTPQTITPTSDRLLNNFTFHLPEGFLLSITVSVLTGVTLRGQTWVTADVASIQGAARFDYQGLFADYVTRENSPQWPGGRNISSIEGPGVITPVTIGAPALGAPQVITPPVNTLWKVHAFVATFTASAVVFNRLPTMQVRDPAAAFNIFKPSTPVTAGQTVVFTGGVWGYQPLDIPAQLIYYELVQGVSLRAGFSLQIGTSGIDPGDQFASAEVGVEEWLEPTS